MLKTLTGRRALITGSSHGVGQAAAKLFVEQGAAVIMHGNSNIARAENIAAELGDSVVGVLQADLSKPGEGTRLFQEADELVHGELDVVINNAGIHLATPFDDEAQWEANWEAIHQVNVKAVADISRAAVRAWEKREGGSLVNIASRAGYRGESPDFMAYAASKAAVLAMTKTIARQWGRRNIFAYALAPGWINTRMAPQNADGLRAARDEIPIGRMAEPEEIAAMCAFLASGACESATGSCIDVNGASYVR